MYCLFYNLDKWTIGQDREEAHSLITLHIQQLGSISPQQRHHLGIVVQTTVK